MKLLTKKNIAIGMTIVFVIFAAIQLVPSSFSYQNPPVTGEPKWNSSETRSLFVKACADCHSNETRFPWYSTVAPVSWLVDDDVRSGRQHFNISEWDRHRQNGDEAAEEVRHGSMPPGLFLLMHPEANLSAEEKKRFIEGLTATFGDTEHKRNEIKFE